MLGKIRYLVFVIAVVLAISAGVARAVPSSHNGVGGQNYGDTHEQDYSKNKNYQLGMRDGKDDRAHNRDHSKKRHFKKDEDQKAYETGYQQSYHANQPNPR